jgi:DNA-directed RNA polymerase specialized sigma24 family protein
MEAIRVAAGVCRREFLRRRVADASARSQEVAEAAEAKARSKAEDPQDPTRFTSKAGYIGYVVTTACRDARRILKEEQPSDMLLGDFDGFTAAGAPSLDLVVHAENIEQVRRALELLTPTEIRVLRLRLLDEQTFQQISQQLCVPRIAAFRTWVRAFTTLCNRVAALGGGFETLLPCPQVVIEALLKLEEE